MKSSVAFGAEIKKRENEQYATFKYVLAKLEEQESEIAELKAPKAQAEDDCAYWKKKLWHKKEI